MPSLCYSKTYLRLHFRFLIREIFRFMSFLQKLLMVYFNLFLFIYSFFFWLLILINLWLILESYIILGCIILFTALWLFFVFDLSLIINCLAISTNFLFLCFSLSLLLLGLLCTLGCWTSWWLSFCGCSLQLVTIDIWCTTKINSISMKNW